MRLTKTFNTYLKKMHNSLPYYVNNLIMSKLVLLSEYWLDWIKIVDFSLSNSIFLGMFYFFVHALYTVLHQISDAS